MKCSTSVPQQSCSKTCHFLPCASYCIVLRSSYIQFWVVLIPLFSLRPSALIKHAGVHHLITSNPTIMLDATSTLSHVCRKNTGVTKGLQTLVYQTPTDCESRQAILKHGNPCTRGCAYNFGPEKVQSAKAQFPHNTMNDSAIRDLLFNPEIH